MKTLFLILAVFLLLSSVSFADLPTYEDEYANPEVLNYHTDGRSVCIAFVIREKVISSQYSFDRLYSLVREELFPQTQHDIFNLRKFTPDQAVAVGYWRDMNSIDRKAYLFLEADPCVDGEFQGIAYELFPSSQEELVTTYLPVDGACDQGENICDGYDPSHFEERFPSTPLPRADDEDSDDSGGCNTTSDDTSKFLSALMLLIGVLALVLGSRRRAAPRD